MPRPLRRPSGNQIRTRRTGSFSVPRLALRLRTGPAARKEVLPLMAFSSMQTPLSGITSLKQDLRILGSILQLSAQYLPVLHKRKGGVSNEGGRGGEGNRGRVGGGGQGNRVPTQPPACQEIHRACNSRTQSLRGGSSHVASAHPYCLELMPSFWGKRCHIRSSTEPLKTHYLGSSHQLCDLGQLT